MPTTQKNVSDYLKTAGWVLLSLIIVVIVIFVIPANVLFWVALVIAERVPNIGLIALGILPFFLAYKTYKTYRFINLLESPWQTFKQA